MAGWLDSHCHINDKEAYKDELHLIFDKMVKNDVKKCLIVSLNPDEYLYTSTIKDERIKIKRALGIYPEDVIKYENKEDDFYKYFEEIDAIGEIGLDYHCSKEYKEKQKEIFIKQCELAREYNKPIIVHTRDAIQDTYDILKAHPCRGVLHCYSGSAEMAEEFIKLGYYISIAGTITFKNAKEPNEVIKVVPLERLLIETDSPYLTPVPNRGKRNDPSNVIYTGKYISEKLGIDEETFKKQIDVNYETLFSR